MNPTRFGLKMAKNTPPDNGLFKNLLKNQIRELEKQLTENNFLNSSLISQQLSSLLNPRTRHWMKTPFSENIKITRKSWYKFKAYKFFPSEK